MYRATPANSGKTTSICLIVFLQAQGAVPGGRGGLGTKTDSPPGGSVHWGVVGGCDPARAQTGGIFRAALAKSVNKLAKGRC